MCCVTTPSRTRSLRATVPGISLLTIGLATALLTGVAVPAHASTETAVSTARDAIAAADAGKDAATMRASAIDLRRDVASLLQEYIDTYRTRFSASELTQLEGYRTDADRQLASVVVTTTRLRTAIAQGRSTRQIESARRAALASWTRARTAADTSWSQARTIMEPKLSFLERLSALSDYNDMIGRFDALGEEIRTVGS
jgi:hypothetical protein